MRALNQPESWWGWHGYNHPEAMSITQILRARTLPVRVVAILWLAMERGASLILAADPPGAGDGCLLHGDGLLGGESQRRMDRRGCGGRGALTARVACALSL